jgi:hypothetical protein
MTQGRGAEADLQSLLAILKAADLFAWEVRRVRESNDQLYLVFDEVESLRRVESETFSVQIYLQVERDGKLWLGESGWTANPGDDFAADLALAIRCSICQGRGSSITPSSSWTRKCKPSLGKCSGGCATM